MPWTVTFSKFKFKNEFDDTFCVSTRKKLNFCFSFHIYRATVEQFLAETQNQEFQQLQQELLQQQTQDNHQLDQQLNFALQQTQFQTSQPMDLLMGDQSQQTANMQQRNDDTASMNVNSMNACQNAMSTQMQSEMDQMLDIDFMQVLKCFETGAPTGENLGDLAGGLSLFNDMDVMNIGK